MIKIMKVVLFLSVLFTLVTLPVRGVVPDGHTDNKVGYSDVLDTECRKNQKCFQCIRTLGCMWCKDKGLELGSRCLSNQSLANDCKDSENPQGEINLNRDDMVKINASESHGINPQVVQLSLRKGEKLNISLEYTDEKDQPLDLYIVMDNSCTMKKHKDTVAKLASTLASNLRNLTKNLRIGFGSFVDKPLAPFGILGLPVHTKTSQCQNENISSLPYGFKNNLKLTEDIHQFIHEVNTTGISSNNDFPKGTLDGLLQSVVCTEQIGWRTGKGNRKLVVISTDGNFHLAGDGKLVGAVLPHDGLCHVDSSMFYTQATVLDYPSVSLVRQKIRENEVFVIFAVTEPQKETYNQLSQQLHPFAVTRGIDNEDNSITSVIENEYKRLQNFPVSFDPFMLLHARDVFVSCDWHKLVNTVTLLSEYSHKEYVDIKFYAKCPGESEFQSTDQCNEVGMGVKVSYKIEVELKDCPSNSDLWQSNVTIFPRSSSENNMIIQLSMLCDCKCEAETQENSLVTKSLECSNQGSLQCGICYCDPGYGGPSCNCTGESGHIGMDQCVYPMTGDVCNKRGQCDSCGKCTCDKKDGNSFAYSGTHCECDNTNCPMEPGDKGPCNKDAEDGSHGKCECSQCVCQSGNFTGPRCECPTSDKNCRDPESPSSDVICNGIGSCKCGKCICGPTNTGPFCQIQHARLNGSCEAARIETEKCVKCLVSRYSAEETDGAKSERCEGSCKGISVDIRERIADRVTEEEEENICKDYEVDKNGCRVDYIIREKNILSGRIWLEIEPEKVVLREKCPTPAPLLEIMLGIIIAMVLIGTGLLLLWKVVTHIQDRREYERFEKAINDVSWNTNEMNPLYKSTTSQFRNPAYLDYEATEGPPSVDEMMGANTSSFAKKSS